MPSCLALLPSAARTICADCMKPSAAKQTAARSCRRPFWSRVRLELDLGGRRLVVWAHGPAHTDTDLTIFDEKTSTFWLADLLFVDRIPVIDGSIVGWLDELRKVTAIPAARAVPGHGPISVPWPQAAAPERRYLETVLRDTRAAIKAGIDIADAYRHVAQSERPHWLLFDDYHARNVTASYKELEWE